MNIEQAKKFIKYFDENDRHACNFCPYDENCPERPCSDVKIEAARIVFDSCKDDNKAAQTIITALEAELADAKKVSSERYDVINKQAVTILSMRNCGNCQHSTTSRANQICVGCHGFEDVSNWDKKTYLAKWEMKK